MTAPIPMRPKGGPDPDDPQFEDDQDRGRVPPCDLDAEGAVLSAILFDSAALETVRSLLAPRHFFSYANRKIYQAIVDLDAAGTAIDVLTVQGRLADAGDLQRVGGVRYLADVLGSVQAISHPAEYARRIVGKERARAAITSFRRLSAEGYLAQDLDAYLDTATRELEALRSGTPRSSAFELASTADIFAPVPPTPWLCRDLAIGPGRPTLVAGYGYSGKTVFLQAMCLAIASGERMLGRFFCQRGRVLHLDYEQGSSATNKRYQRLAFAADVSEQALDGRLQTVYFPPHYMSSPGFEDAIAREAEHFDLVAIDSFKAACPDVDEIDSGIRRYLDILTRVSEKTGTSFVVIHHAGKGKSNGDSREVARGNSSIFDACGTVIVLKGTKPFEPFSVELAKTSASRSGRSEESFFVRLEDVPDDDAADMQAGLRLVYQTEEQVEEPQTPRQKIDTMADRILTELQKPDSRAGVSLTFLSGLKLGDKNLIGPALDLLYRRGLVESVAREGKRGGGRAWRLCGEEQAKGEDE